MSKFIVYSNTNGQVWNALDQYFYEEDGTLAGGINGVNTLRYHSSTNPGVVEISDEDYKQLDINNLNKYVVVDNTLIEKPEDSIVLDNIEDFKNYKIQQSKIILSEWLENNPMLYTDGKYYSVTAEKQSLLNGNLASYERAKTAGIDYPLKWNSTGAECEPWNYTDLVSLSLAIAEYVAPKVSMQQAYELQIKACETIEEVNEIVINYDE